MQCINFLFITYFNSASCSCWPYNTLTDLLFILPEFLNAEDVEFVSVDVRQETVGLSDQLALRRASAVSHQIHTITCAQHRHRRIG